MSRKLILKLLTQTLKTGLLKSSWLALKLLNLLRQFSTASLNPHNTQAGSKPVYTRRLSPIVSLGLVGVVLIALFLDVGSNIPLTHATTLPPRYYSSTDGNWFWQNPLLQGFGFSSVSCPDANICFAVGGGGTIEATTNGGLTWTAHVAGTNQYLTGIDCTDTKHCTIIGRGGTLLATADGQAWLPQTPPAGFSTDLESVSCPDANTCYAVGDYDKILSRINGQWQTQNSPVNSTNLYSVSCPSATVCYAVGGPTIVVLTNGQWHLQTSPTQNTLYGVSCPDVNTCFAVGDNGTIIYTGNGGLNWSVQPPNVLPPNFTTRLFGVKCPAITVCYAVGLNGTIIAAVNSNWTLQNSFTPIGLYSVSCPSTTTCLAVGSASMSVATSNSGSKWKVGGIFSQTSYDLRATNCPSPGVCYAVGILGTILKADLAVNNGDWSAPQNPTLSTLNDLSCPTVNTCYAVGDSATLLVTTDGGANWLNSQTLPIGFTANIRGVSCITTLKCYAVGDNGVIIATTNGATWGYQTGPVGFNTNLTDLSCPGPLLCFAVGDSGKIIATSDGTNWSLQPNLPVGFNTNLKSINCPTTQICFAVGDSGTIIAAINSPWSVIAGVPTTQDLKGIGCRPATMACYAIGNNGTMLNTSNGTIWLKQPSETYYAFNGISCPLQCVSVGDSGTILANAQVVTNSTDNAPNSPGTLTYAINRSGFNQAIMFEVNSVTLNPNNYLPTLINGTKLMGSCDPVTGPQVTLVGGKGTLGLSANNTLYGLKLTNFNGASALTIHAPQFGSQTHVQCVKVVQP